jgi:TonB family protein
MNAMTRLLAKGVGVIFGTLAIALPALAMTNEESVRELKLTEFELPVFPKLAKCAGYAEGIVTTIIAHDVNGRPTDVLVLDSSHPRFTEAVREAVAHWKFEANAALGADHPPLVRFYFSTKGVVMLQSQTEHGGVMARMLPSKLQFPTFRALDAPPKPIEQPMPEFPLALRGRVKGGAARVAFYVDESGHARAPVVTEATSPEFAAAALAAVAQWRYEAPRQNGRPVIAVGNWDFHFAGPVRS